MYAIIQIVTCLVYCTALSTPVISQSHCYFFFFLLGCIDVPSPDPKGDYCDYLDSPIDYVPEPSCTVHEMDQPDLGYLISDLQGDFATDTEVCTKQEVTEENLRDSLKKVLEFCFSR